MFDFLEKVNYYWHAHRGRVSYFAFFMAGILFVPFLFNLYLYFARKRKTEHLLFSIICLLVIVETAVTQLIILSNRISTYTNINNLVSQVIALLFSILLPMFFLYVFSLPKKIITAIVGVNLLVFLVFTDMTNIINTMSVTMLILSSIITVWALILKRDESILILSGLILSWLAFISGFEFASLAAIMVVCTSFSTARQFARKEKAEREAQFKAVQLENQLLKKNINPHFLLNTLQSIMVWMKKDPKLATQLVEAFAEEFRAIMKVSPLKEISLKEEIDLCRTHLEIMNYRKDANYKLITTDIIADDNIPPMIFHTLLENGLTHGYEDNINGTFTLVRKKTPDSVQYIFSNDGDYGDNEQKESYGFGFHYIKSRLEESYPGRWSFVSDRKEEGWETVITIKDK